MKLTRMPWVSLHLPDSMVNFKMVKLMSSLESNVSRLTFLNLIATMDMGQIKAKKHLALKASSNCWICEGWTEFRFTFEP